MASNAFGSFETLLGSVDQLIEIHGRLQTGAGRRHRQDALHRSGVVLTVAAWQAYVEKVSVDALDWIESQIAGPLQAPLNPHNGHARVSHSENQPFERLLAI